MSGRGVQGLPPPGGHRGIPTEKQSPVASNPTSSGGEIGKGINFYLLFIWIVSSSWQEASFTDWKATKQLSHSLAEKIADQIEKDSSPQEKAKFKKTLELHFQALSLNQRKSLETFFVEHPQLSTWLISECVKQDRQSVGPILLRLTQEGQIALLQKLEYQASSIPPTDRFAFIKNSLITLPNKATTQLISTIKEGKFYKVKHQPSLLPSKLTTHSSLGMIRSQDLERAKKILQGNDTEPPRIRFFVNAKGDFVSIPCTITSATVKNEKGNALELEFTTTYAKKDLVFRIEIPYAKGETEETIIERIEKDGSLAKAMLLATSDFTKRMVP